MAYSSGAHSATTILAESDAFDRQLPCEMLTDEVHMLPIRLAGEDAWSRSELRRLAAARVLHAYGAVGACSRSCQAHAQRQERTRSAARCYNSPGRLLVASTYQASVFAASRTRDDWVPSRSSASGELLYSRIRCLALCERNWEQPGVHSGRIDKS